MTALIVRADATRLPLPDASVDLIVTSPPYWSLRSYTDDGEHYEGQIGSEPTPGEYIDALLACTREWMRVLKPSGSLWVNLSDKYSSGSGGESGMAELGRRLGTGGGHKEDRAKVRSGRVPGTRPKSQLNLPERYRIGCTDQLGLIQRAKVIWSKPNGLPESVTDRVRCSHEDWVHLTKEPRYFSAVDAIREEHTGGTHPSGKNAAVQQWESGKGVRHRTGRSDPELFNPLGKMPSSVWEIEEDSDLLRPVLSAIHTGSLSIEEGERILTGVAWTAAPTGGTRQADGPGSVWTIATEPLRVPEHLGVDHFAAFPTEWPRRLILGWSPSGICTACGEGRRPVVDHVRTFDGEPVAPGEGGIFGDTKRITRNKGVGNFRFGSSTSIIGEACACSEPSAPTRQAVVLDPFGGTGTTSLVASVLGRTGISVDLSADYCRLATWRTTDPGERARAMRVPKPPKQTDGQQSLFDGAAS